MVEKQELSSLCHVSVVLLRVSFIKSFEVNFLLVFRSVSICSSKLLHSHRGRSSKPIFVQIAKQVVSLNPLELRLPSRAWKVKLVGEGADDAGGVFDDTITEMCQVEWKPEGLRAASSHGYSLIFFDK